MRTQQTKPTNQPTKQIIPRHVVLRSSSSDGGRSASDGIATKPHRKLKQHQHKASTTTTKTDSASESSDADDIVIVGIRKSSSSLSLSQTNLTLK